MILRRYARPLLQKFAEFFDADVGVAKNSPQRTDRYRSAFVDWNGHSFVIGGAPHVQMAALLPLFVEARALQGANQLLAIHSRKLVTHAATGTDRRVMKMGSRSAGMGSPSSRKLSM